MRRRTSRLNHYGSTSSLQSLGWGRHSCSAEGIRALVEEELHKRRGNCAARTRRLTSLSEYSAYSRESGDSSVATGVSRNERAKRLSAVGAKNVDLSPLARLETRANDNHRLTPVATGMPPLPGSCRDPR